MPGSEEECVDGPCDTGPGLCRRGSGGEALRGELPRCGSRYRQSLRGSGGGSYVRLACGCPLEGIALPQRGPSEPCQWAECQGASPSSADGVPRTSSCRPGSCR